ncbi:hydroxyacid dehydrogenase [Campylobacter concisus]|uniref:Hydroxyacid dehydrogenase n=1 Tax=Campylobacter concisus TaxID=199 RepID=A0A1Y5MQY9_9BACT|nr:D-2-hydroxyacid dehydrogenase [Campylobacter concisus]OUT11011.1 hydroxyacid dehydrogenase [Campylobacter concisus]
MKIVCLDAATLGENVDLSVFKKFGEFISYQKTKSEEIVLRLKGVDVVITNKVIIDKAVMEATNLKLICISATGMNNVDLEHAKAKNIAVKNVAGYSTASVVQHTFAMLFELTNHIKFYDHYVKSGEWVKSEIFTYLGADISEIASKEFGIIGLGEIGRGVAAVARAFGANVSYYSTSGANNNRKFKQKSLEELLRSSDIISIHAPLNEKTRNLLGTNEINLLKDDAIVLNLGRGGIVDEAAMARAIDERNLRFGTDVLESEPMSKNSPFLNVKNKENLLITPHVAWGSLEARKTLIAKIVANIENFINESK